ncbi:hypothetical protein J6590_067780 [Homalodisca vitripennis]|nr:hypothetical protein J6590_067780 [Homalodisca vitripennis]
MEKLYIEFSSSIARSEYRTAMPVSELNFNAPNNNTTFKLDHGDAFYDSRIMYHIQGKYVQKSDGSDYQTNSTVKLVDNFAAFLFSRIELRKHNTLIDTVELSGITSTIKGIVSYRGWKFEALGTLQLALGTSSAQAAAQSTALLPRSQYIISLYCN